MPRVWNKLIRPNYIFICVMDARLCNLYESVIPIRLSSLTCGEGSDTPLGSETGWTAWRRCANAQTAVRSRGYFYIEKSGRICPCGLFRNDNQTRNSVGKDHSLGRDRQCSSTEMGNYVPSTASADVTKWFKKDVGFSSLTSRDRARRMMRRAVKAPGHGSMPKSP